MFGIAREHRIHILFFRNPKFNANLSAYGKTMVNLLSCWQNVKVIHKGLFVDRLKQLCLLTGIVLLMVLAVLCIIGSVMGADWSRWFFNTLPGGGLWVCLGLLIIAGLSQFTPTPICTVIGQIKTEQKWFCRRNLKFFWLMQIGVGVYRAKWPLAVYLGALLVLMGSLVNCGYTVFAGFILSCTGLFGLLWTRPDRVDVIIAILLLLAIVFISCSRIISVPSHRLNSVFFVPHVFAYFLSYVFLAKAAFFAVKHLFDRMPETEKKSYRFVSMAFPLLTAGLMLGSVWAAFAWGDWWSWDPKEMFSLAVWLVFAAFLHFRYLYGQRFLKLNSLWIIMGFVLIILGLSLVSFSKIFAGLHNYAA